MPDTASWHPDPTFRGTWGIVSTCVSTLIICVWNAIHFNIPPRDQKWSFLHKLPWLLCGLFAPDLLIIVAGDQLDDDARFISAAARRYLRTRCSSVRDNLSLAESVPLTGSEANDKLSDSGSKSSGLSNREHAWTLAHSFYAYMGGFVLDSSLTPAFGTDKTLTLAPRLFVFLMEHAPDIIPDISEADIQRKGKSSWLAKALLVSQLLYFSISCAARLAQKLSLTLLEVWTLAHALGAIGIYVLWWKKPFDAAEPIVIGGEQAQEFAAYFQMVARYTISAGFSDTQAYAEGIYYLKITASTESTVTQDQQTDLLERENWPITLLAGNSIQLEGYTFTVQARKPDPDNDILFAKTPRPWYARERGPDGSVSVSKADVQRWRLAARAATRLGGIWEQPADMELRRTSGLWELSSSLQGSSGSELALFAAMWVIPTMCALLHVLGWNATFPTLAERILWRVGAVVTSAGPTAFFLAAIIGSDLEDRVKTANSPVLSHVLRILSWTGSALMFTVAFLYVLSNLYFFVESIRQLLYLPDDAFLLPSFSVYFPHFS
ncbi:hypothetical protein PsYK624_125950 [Phanerochaete sordida]|uniref:Uncharacterized protein n=1 Tax=Phanerochaete sordida TaxID=48140 RepID=A0A9P3LJ77_9APHY|nr:hypothetical protein PsYK624_125950 [Phanerochaete sordida]